MATARQIAAARRNIKKAQAARRAMGLAARVGLRVARRLRRRAR